MPDERMLALAVHHSSQFSGAFGTAAMRRHMISFFLSLKEGSRRFLASYWDCLKLIKSHPHADITKGKCSVDVVPP